MIRLIIVDSHPLIRAAIGRLLTEESDMEVVGEAGTAETALRLARDVRPDVVLLDLRIGAMGVLEAIQRLRRLDNAMKIVTLGEQEGGPMPLRALEAGAHGYVSRASDETEFRKAIRRVHANGRYISPMVAQNVALNSLDPDGNPMIRLTPRELSVIMMLGQGRARREISDSLCVSPKTVSTYRTRALRKLGARSDVELAHLCLQHGLLQPFAPAATA